MAFKSQFSKVKRKYSSKKKEKTEDLREFGSSVLKPVVGLAALGVGLAAFNSVS